jgi:hypothetical protein
VQRVQVGPGPAEASTWALDLSPDGRWLASLIVDKGLVIWDLISGRTPTWFEMPGVRLLCFHPARPELYLTSQRDTVQRRLTLDTATTSPTPRLGEATSLPQRSNAGARFVFRRPNLYH